MDDLKYLCMGCMSMKPSDQERCPNCGYSESESNLPSYLKTKTKLNDRYIIGKVLRVNGESVLYVAYDTVKSERVCIREFMPDTLCSRKPDSDEIAVNPNCLAQYKTLLSEFIELNKSLSKLRTISQIATVYELFPQNNTAYVVLEYVNGMTLNNYLRLNAGELSWAQVKELFTPLFTALNLIHAEGIIHKGLSPETIYVINDSKCKITDFSISAARTANSEIAAELFAGYTAPEQYSSSNWHGTWTDVYSLAAVLYRCLTGCMPPESLTRTANDNLSEPNQVNKQIPHNVSKAITNAMKISTEARSKTIEIFLTELFEEPSYLVEEPKEKATKNVAHKKKDDALSSEKKNISIALKAGLITFAFLAVIAMILIIIFVPDRSSKDKDKINHTTTTTTSASTTETTEITTDETDSKKPVSTGKQYVMPNFIGLEYIRINVASYNMPIVLEPEYVYTTEHDKGDIYEQTVEPGTVFSEETTIAVKVSKGSQFVNLPSYTDKNVSDYVATLNSLGIKYEVIYDDGYPNIENNMIIYVKNVNGNKIDASTVIDMENASTIYVVVSSYTPEEENNTDSPAE